MGATVFEANAKLRTENEALRAKLPRWIPSAESRLKLRDGQLVVISVPGHGCYAATYRAWSGDLPCHYKENDDIDAIADPDDAGHWVYVIPTPPAAPEQEPTAPYSCKYCGCPSWLEPSEQTPPPDYCHESDHGTPEQEPTT